MTLAAMKLSTAGHRFSYWGCDPDATPQAKAWSQMRYCLCDHLASYAKSSLADVDTGTVDLDDELVSVFRVLSEFLYNESEGIENGSLQERSRLYSHSFALWESFYPGSTLQIGENQLEPDRRYFTEYLKISAPKQTQAPTKKSGCASVLVVSGVVIFVWNLFANP